jgi:hypothetical protein
MNTEEQPSIEELTQRLNRVSLVLQQIRQESKERDAKSRATQLSYWVALRKLDSNQRKLKAINLQRARIEAEFNELSAKLKENGKLANLHPGGASV